MLSMVQEEELVSVRTEVSIGEQSCVVHTDTHTICTNIESFRILWINFSVENYLGPFFTEFISVSPLPVLTWDMEPEDTM